MAVLAGGSPKEGKAADVASVAGVQKSEAVPLELLRKVAGV